MNFSLYRQLKINQKKNLIIQIFIKTRYIDQKNKTKQLIDRSHIRDLIQLVVDYILYWYPVFFMEKKSFDYSVDDHV